MAETADIDLYEERLTDAEYVLCVQRSPQSLNDEEREQRVRITGKQLDIDSMWGFFDTSWYGTLRRTVYKTFVHGLLKKR